MVPWARGGSCASMRGVTRSPSLRQQAASPAGRLYTTSENRMDLAIHVVGILFAVNASLWLLWHVTGLPVGGQRVGLLRRAAGDDPRLRRLQSVAGAAARRSSGSGGSIIPPSSS